MNTTCSVCVCVCVPVVKSILKIKVIINKTIIQIVVYFVLRTNKYMNIARYHRYHTAVYFSFE